MTVTQDINFAAAIGYTFGDESLLKVDFPEQGVTNFTFDAPSLDCQEYLSEFKAGTFAISDLMSYVKSYTKLVSRLKLMRRDGISSWASPSWIAGRG
jgi:hypothetical protein